MSNQRPRIGWRPDGVCSACDYQEKKRSQIDWAKREKELENLLDFHRRQNGTHDVLVPCSGGKDGSFVAHRLKFKYGMNPLTVTWAPLLPTSHGFGNLRRFIETGFDHVLGTPNPKIAARLSLWALKNMGDPFQPFIYGQTNFPLRIAIQEKISPIMYGENGEEEYGGDSKGAFSPTREIADHSKHYFSGVSPDYLLSKGFGREDLALYLQPGIAEIRENNTEIHFFGYYLPWDPQENYYYASRHTGFLPNPERTQGTYSKYASLDDKIDGFHYFLSFLKFGIGRATSDSAHEIRDGRISRDEGVQLVRKFDAEFPDRYLEECLDFWGISESDLRAILRSWTNSSLFDLEKDGHELRYAVWR